jgi:hypothetical protein
VGLVVVVNSGGDRSTNLFTIAGEVLHGNHLSQASPSRRTSQTEGSGCSSENRPIDAAVVRAPGALNRIPYTERAKILDAAAKSAHSIACTLDEKITKDNQLSMADPSRIFADEIVQTWYKGELNPYILELTPEEAAGLKTFFYVNELITRCYALSAQLSSEHWKEIQQQMLQPFAGNIQNQNSHSEQFKASS